MKYIKTLKLMVSDLINVVDYLDEKNKDAGFSLGCIVTKIEHVIEDMEKHENEGNQNHGC